MSWFNNVSYDKFGGDLEWNLGNKLADLGDTLLSGARLFANKCCGGGKSYLVRVTDADSGTFSFRVSSDSEYEDTEERLEKVGRVIALICFFITIPLGCLCKCLSMIDTEVRLKHKVSSGVILSKAQETKLSQLLNTRRDNKINQWMAKNMVRI